MNGTVALTTLAAVNELSSIAWHPTLSVVYGVAGRTDSGYVLAWSVDDAAAVELSAHNVGAEEHEPCHMAVTPDGKLLAVANYTSSEITLWPLSTLGAISGSPHRVSLNGSGPDPTRQESAHPHQIVFSATTAGTRMFVPDLGADVLREFDLRGGTPPELTVHEVAIHRLPSGTGPRHMVVLPDGRIAVSGELSSTLIVLTPLTGELATTSSTLRRGPARSRTPRNYPGDLRASPDGNTLYLANRGYDTVAVFDVGGSIPRMLLEFDPNLAWPQHLHVTSETLTVAGWDSSRVATFGLRDGIPQGTRWNVDVPHPAWIIPTFGSDSLER